MPPDPAGVVFVDGFKSDSQVTTFLDERGSLVLVVPGELSVGSAFGDGWQLSDSTQGDPLDSLQGIEVDALKRSAPTSVGYCWNSLTMILFRALATRLAMVLELTLPR